MSLNWKNILIGSLLLVSSAKAGAQDSIQLKLLGNISAFAVDAKGNMLVSDDANTLYKFNKNGNKITNINTKVYGSISSIDCSNPFEIYTYYQEQNILVFLDNMLNIRGEMRLNDLGYSNVACLGRSYDNGVWIYDFRDQELKKLNKEGKIENRSGNLRNFIQGTLSPYKIIDHKNQVYLADSAQGILVFDIFGTYIKTIPLYQTNAFDISDSLIVAIQGKSILSFNRISFTQRFIHPAVKPLFLSANNTGLYYAAGNRIFIYRRD